MGMNHQKIRLLLRLGTEISMLFVGGMESMSMATLPSVITYTVQVLAAVNERLQFTLLSCESSTVTFSTTIG